MSRLILIPQYPVKLRYQEWWNITFPLEFSSYFDEVITLRGDVDSKLSINFSLIDEAVAWEISQVNQYMKMTLHEDDVLLLNDLSFPGLFSQILFHKRPRKCFAICHATSKNRYDLFSENREIKYPIEQHTAKLFNEVFVASHYHKNKLRWNNIVVVSFPIPTFFDKYTLYPLEDYFKTCDIISVARNSIQKRTKKLEQKLEKETNYNVRTRVCKTWEEYVSFLRQAKILLITSKEETYGYQVIDAVMNNCIPVAPNKYSYPELLPREYLYSSYAELKEIVNKVIKEELSLPKLLVMARAKKFYETLSSHMKNEI